MYLTAKPHHELEELICRNPHNKIKIANKYEELFNS